MDRKQIDGMTIHHPAGRFSPPAIRPFRCDGIVLAQDRDFTSARSAFKRAAKLVRNFGSRLRKIARDIDSLVKHYDVETPAGQSLLQAALLRYRDDLGQYAERSADKMLFEVAKADERDWRRMSAEIGRGVEKAIASAPIAPVIEQMKADTVRLIKSLPEDASARVARCAVEGLAKGQRASVIAEEIMRTGSVTRARADLISRTETGRAQTALTMARAQHVGSEGYLWRTAGDYDVRASHKAMSGKFVRWDSPPTLDGLTGHAGSLPNCRCYCEPSISDLD